MIHDRVRIACAALAAAFVGAASAQTSQLPLTRGQVHAELLEAQRLGGIPSGESGRTPREVSPTRYPAADASPGLTRAEVLQQLRQSRLDGDVEVGETGRTAYEIAPRNYPQREMAQGESRDQVRAEYRESRRAGELVANDEIGGKLNERFPYRFRESTTRALATASRADSPR